MTLPLEVVRELETLAIRLLPPNSINIQRILTRLRNGKFDEAKHLMGSLSRRLRTNHLPLTSALLQQVTHPVVSSADNVFVAKVYTVQRMLAATFVFSRDWTQEAISDRAIALASALGADVGHVEIDEHEVLPCP